MGPNLGDGLLGSDAVSVNAVLSSVILRSTSPSALPPWLLQVTRSPFLNSWLSSSLLFGVLFVGRGHGAAEPGCGLGFEAREESNPFHSGCPFRSQREPSK